MSSADLRPTRRHDLDALRGVAMLLGIVLQFLIIKPGNRFGPATSIGLLPIPAVFLYYAIFFAYGAMYYDAADKDVRVGRVYWWKLILALGLLVVPSAHSSDHLRSVSGKWVGNRPLDQVLDRLFGDQRRAAVALPIPSATHSVRSVTQRLAQESKPEHRMP